ncbi:radical SAM/SPASM domain-containing protein [Candidatus Altiarchaeota archaeon]
MIDRILKNLRILRNSTPPQAFALLRFHFNKRVLGFDTPRYPVELNIEVSTVCNLRCIYCESGHKPPQFLTPEGFTKILAALPAIPCVEFVGLGETLMNPQIDELIGIARKKGMYTSITTNGTLLTKDMISRLESAGLNELAVSLDLPSKEVEAIRCGLDFDQLDKNLDNLKHSRLRTLIKAVVSTDNVDKLNDLVDYAKAKGIPRVRFIEVYTATEYNRTNCEMLFVPRDITSRKIAAAIEHGKSINVIVQNATSPQKNCFWPFDLLRMHIDGEIMPCCKLDMGDYGMGNLFNEGFDGIWFGGKFEGLRKSFLTGDLQEKCHGCIYVNS